MEPKLLEPPNDGTVAQDSAAGGNGSARNGAAPHQDEPPELLAELAEIRRLLEAGEVPTARRMARELPLRWPASPRAAKMAEILGPPRVRTVSAGGGFSVDREQAWLRSNAHAYPGCWLAVLGDTLIAADPNLARVLEQVSAVPGGEQALLHRQPALTNSEP